MIALYTIYHLTASIYQARLPNDNFVDRERRDTDRNIQAYCELFGTISRLF